MITPTSFFDTPTGVQTIMALILGLGIILLIMNQRYKKTRGLDIIAFTSIYIYIASGVYHLKYGQLDGYSANIGLDPSSYGSAWQQLLMLAIFMIAYVTKFPKTLDFSREKKDVHIYTLGLIIMSVALWTLVLLDIIPITPSFPMQFRELFLTWAQIIGGTAILANFFLSPLKQ